MQLELTHKQIKILKNQCKETLTLIEYLEGLHGQIHIEHEIKLFFKHRKYLGSRDRKFINNHVYGFYRWKGWLGSFSSIELVLMIELLDGCYSETSVAFFAEHQHVSLSATDIFNFSKLQSIDKKQAYLNDFFNLKLELNHLVPEWMHEFIDQNAFEAFIRANAERAPLWVRLQHLTPAKFKEFFPDENCIEFETLPNCIGFPSKTSIEQHPLYLSGKLEIQDLGSQIIGEICSPYKSEFWWDACTGAGGKALLLADKLKNGNVFASDIRGYKLKELRRRAGKANLKNIKTGLFDLEKQVSKFEYNGILVDAPCSCSGTWRRRPSDRWKTTKQELEAINQVQHSILHKAARSVKIGGHLIYATCSVFSKENREVVQTFLGNNKNYALEPFLHPITKTPTDGTLQVLPQEFGSDGMYMARMKRLR